MKWSDERNDGLRLFFYVMLVFAVVCMVCLLLSNCWECQMPSRMV